jgi:hypothetical protein
MTALPDGLTPELVRDAVEIADESSEALLRCGLNQSDEGWWNVASADPWDRQAIDQAVRYLTARGKIERHPKHREWVRVK